jgi:hypothetical protein
MDMQFHEQRQQALLLLEQSGIGRNTYAPPLFRILWRCGVQVRPPHFMGFGALASLCGIWFGIGWGAVMWLMVWSRQHVDVRAMLIGAGVAGLCFGLFMATYITRQARKHALPRWESLA